jgi:hypothetical protein
MPHQSQLFERAAECSRRIHLTQDPVKKQTFKQLRDMWIALANESAIMSRAELTEEITSIEAIQLGIDPKANFATGTS